MITKEQALSRLTQEEEEALVTWEKKIDFVLSTFMKVIALTPGTMGLCALAIELFGVDNVVPTGWGTPVYVKADAVDLQAGLDLIKERGLAVDMPITAVPTTI